MKLRPWYQTVGTAHLDDVLVRSPWCAGVDIGDGFVVYNGKSATTLDRLQALLWQRIDGSTTLRQIATEFASAFGGQVNEVEVRVLELVSKIDALVCRIRTDVPEPIFNSVAEHYSENS